MLDTLHLGQHLAGETRAEYETKRGDNPKPTEDLDLNRAVTIGDMDTIQRARRFPAHALPDSLEAILNKANKPEDDDKNDEDEPEAKKPLDFEEREDALTRKSRAKYNQKLPGLYVTARTLA